MRLAEALRPEAVRTDLDVTDKDSMLRMLARIFAETSATGAEAAGADEVERLDADTVYRVFSERERLASTGVGSGVAIPHGRLEIDTFRAVMVICPHGVAFDSVDGQPTKIFFAMLGPMHNPAEQLKMLARISRVLKDQAVRARLLAAENRQAAFDILAEEELRH